MSLIYGDVIMTSFLLADLEQAENNYEKAKKDLEATLAELNEM